VKPENKSNSNFKFNWSEKVTNEKALEYVEEKRTLVNNVLHRKANWIECIIRKITFFMMLLKDR
jgi:hypothetical protein